MTPVIDLTYEQSYSTRSIRVRDISIYGNTIIKNPSFEIWPPGFNKVNVPFTPKNINEYRAIDLGLSCDDTEMNLPDGIYEFKYSIFPNTDNWVKKSFMYTNNIVAQMQKLYLTLELDCGCNSSIVSQEKSKLDNIKLLIEGCISAANECDEESAYSFLRKAQDLISRVSCDCGCK